VRVGVNVQWLSNVMQPCISWSMEWGKRTKTNGLSTA
jgi:hypothetical protein